MASGIAERSLRNVSLRCAVLAIVAVLLIVLTLGVQREEAQVAEPQNSVYAGSAPGTTPWNESKSVSHKAWNSNEYPGGKTVNVASGVEKAKVLNGRQGSTGLPFAGPAFCGYRLEYRESQWERFWHENIGDLQSADSVWKDACEYMTKWDSSKVKEYEWMWQRRQQWTLEELMAEQWDKSIFSYHEMVDGCTGDVTMRIPIEPSSARCATRRTRASAATGTPCWTRTGSSRPTTSSSRRTASASASTSSTSARASTTAARAAPASTGSSTRTRRGGSSSTGCSAGR